MINFDSCPSPYLIAEIGINHNGDTQIAKKLIDASFACGWDCVKFQKRNPDLCIPEYQKHILKKTPWGELSYLEYKKKIEFGRGEYDYIDRYCSEKPICWTASVWDFDSLEFLLHYDVPFIKLPSAMLTNDELVAESAKSGHTILLSTGMSSLEEVDHAVEILEKHAVQYALMHTNSVYPSKEDELNLSIIPMMEKRYNCRVGYSGHEYGLEPTVLAVFLGASIIERHITLDHKMWGTDQTSSVEISGMSILKKRIKGIKNYLGQPVKKVTDGELEIRNKLRG